MQVKTCKRGLIPSVMILFAFLAAALFVGMLRDDGGAGPSGSDPTTTTTTTVVDTGGIPDDDLVVRPGDLLPDAARCQSDEFIPNSLPNAEMLWTDSVETPFKSSDMDGVETELFAHICGNPTMGDMANQGLATVNIGDFSVWENNPWMAEMADAVAATGNLRLTFLTKKEEVEGIFVTAEYQQYAEMLNTLIFAYMKWGDDEVLSVQNWHVAGPVADELPITVENDVQEGLLSWIYVYTLKGQECPVSVIGFNDGDKRFEIFEPGCSPEMPPCTENCGTVPQITVPPTTVPGKATPPITSPAPPTSAPTPPSEPDDCVDWGGIWYNGECRWLGDDSGAGAPEPEYPSWGPTPTSEPPGSVPPTTAPPASGNTVAGP